MSSTSTASKKRPAPTAAEGADAFGELQQRRRAQRPRLALEQKSAVDPNPTFNSDVITRIAMYMNVDWTLMNVLVVAGPMGAARIRKEYLVDNDGYAANALQLLKPKQCYYTTDTSTKRRLWRRCRERLRAWMNVNDWKSRCKEERMNNHYRKVLFGVVSASVPSYRKSNIDANLPWNNVAVAVELGFLDVVKYFVEEMKVSVWTTDWDGFGSMSSIPRLAMRHGHIEILEYLLSHDSFDADTVLPVYAAKLMCFAISNINDIEVFKAYMNHPKVNVNLEHPLNHQLLLPFAVTRQFINYNPMDMTEKEVLKIRSHLAKVNAIIDAGANARSRRIAVQYVRGWLERGCKWKVELEDLCQKMSPG